MILLTFASFRVVVALPVLGHVTLGRVIGVVPKKPAVPPLRCWSTSAFTWEVATPKVSSVGISASSRGDNETQRDEGRHDAVRLGLIERGCRGCSVRPGNAGPCHRRRAEKTNFRVVELDAIRIAVINFLNRHGDISLAVCVQARSKLCPKGRATEEDVGTTRELIVVDVVRTHDAKTDAVVYLTSREVHALGHDEIGGTEGESILVIPHRRVEQLSVARSELRDCSAVCRSASDVLRTSSNRDGRRNRKRGRTRARVGRDDELLELARIDLRLRMHAVTAGNRDHVALEERR